MEPYRVFFPLGAIAAVLGTAGWVLFAFGLSLFYPGSAHPDLMVGGFLYAFACGFLMTAVPRFTGSRHATQLEVLFQAGLLILLLAFGFSNTRIYFHSLSIASFVSLITFCARRFRARAYAPPRFFIFVGLGLALGMAGAIFSAANDLQLLSPPIALFGRLLYTQGMILSLIAGVGTHLLPAIFGWSDLPIQITPLDRSKQAVWRQLGPVILLAATLLIAYGIESAGAPTAGRALQAGVLTWLAVRYWRILSLPKSRGWLPKILWISAWTLLSGLWLPVAFPNYWIHAIHLAFIGGIGLMTFAIATRVTLAHGGYGVRAELRFAPLGIPAILFLLAAITRAAAISVPRAYIHHLGYAAVIWIAAVLAWSVAFFPRMRDRSEPV